MLEKNVNAVACYSDRDYLITKSNGNERILSSRGKSDHKLTNQNALLRSVLKTGTNGVGEPFCVTFRTSIFQGNPQRLKWSSRDPIYELETYYHALEFGEFIYCLGKAGLYRVHSNSYSSSVTKYFWQAAQHRKWLMENMKGSSLSVKDKFSLRLTTLIRASMRTIVFWWVK
jgi:hypothetical protein